MTNRFVCLLRGINVSGKNKILMKDLTLLFEDLGFGKVETYIQSGNVSFDSIDIDKKLFTKEFSANLDSM
jgi:uncharacterized protein (DUF1697 family)